MSDTPTPPAVATPELDSWQDTLACFFRAMIPALWLQTAEEVRCFDQVLPVIQFLGLTKCGCRNIQIWSEASLHQYTPWVEKGAPKTKVEAVQVEFQEFFPTLKAFAQQEEITQPDGTKVRGHSPKILLLADAGAALEIPANVRALKETIAAVRGVRKTIILIGKNYHLPVEIQQDITVVPFELPTQAEFKRIIEQALAGYRGTKGYEQLVLDDTQVIPFSRACAGVTLTEMQSILSLAVAKNRAFDDKAVEFALEEKARIVRRSNVLEVLKPKVDLQSVGGLENVKKWVESVTPILNNPDGAREYGLQLPSGLCLLGLSGTGKSLCAEALAAHWRLPLLKFDVGRAFGSLVGESERNIREMIQVAQATAPCIVFIDELDKAFGGDSLDGGTTQRVFGTVLGWLETKPDNVFVIATANDLRTIAKRPELLQRFAETFFVDLPDQKSRVDILRIHLAPKHFLPDDRLEEVALALRAYSGREIRNVVRKGLATAFKAGLKHPTVDQLLAAAKLIAPTSVTLKETIDELRKWCTSGRVMPAGAMLEQETKRSLPNESRPGLPDLGE